MLSYMLGIITGLLIGWIVAGVTAFVAVYITTHPPSILQKTKRIIAQLATQKGSVLEPKRDEVIAMEEMFAANDREGKDTELGDVI